VIAVPDLVVACSPFGVGEVLLTDAAVDGPVMCLAPVGVRSHEREPVASLERWRCARWAEADALLAGAPPDQLDELSVRELVLLVPEPHQDWLRRQLEGQLKAIVAFGDHVSHVRGRRWAEQAAKRLRRELARAFPGESWHDADADASANGRIAALAAR
jgi:hypothetical protein